MRLRDDHLVDPPECDTDEVWCECAEKMRPLWTCLCAQELIQENGVADAELMHGDDQLPL
jgi:hypothetical protein